MRPKRRSGNWFERNLSGHISIRKFGHITLYGFNAMHVALNFHTRRWGWVCFHPTMWCFGGWWPWYFYVSPNGTPGTATYAIGPGVSKPEKRRAYIRRELLGHNFRVDDYDYRSILEIDYAGPLPPGDE
jgi:hypothetical protein